MSFLDTLKSLGLWQGQAQGQPQQPQPNPYGLDQPAMRQAGLAALGNIGGQIMALSQQMTPDQRARMMGQADWTGGLQSNLYNAAQMKLMSDANARKQQEYTRMQEARAMIAEKIKTLPVGPARDAAMFFLQSDDLNKAAEVIFKRERRFNPYTLQTEEFDIYGNPAVRPATAQPSGATQAQPAMVTPPSAAGGAPAPGPSPIPPPTGTSTVGAAAGDVDAVTQRWRALTRDQNLTPQEVQQMIAAAAANPDPATAPDAAMKVYRELVKNRIDAANKEEDQTTTVLNQNRSAAEQLTSAYDASTKSYDTIIGAGQRAAQVATNPNMPASAKLSTLYQFMKALDPDGAVREGDVAMAQAMQSIKDQWMQFAESQINGGGPISDTMVMDMAREMARLANDAVNRKEQKRLQMIKRATGRSIPLEMVTDFGNGSQNMPKPIGLDIPSAPAAPAQSVPIPVEAARELQADPSPEARAEFDATFGAGAAARVLGGR